MEHAEINSAYKVMVAEIVSNPDLYYLCQYIAESEEFRKEDTIIAYKFGIKELAPLVRSYGYEMVNEFVRMWSRALGARNESDSSAG